MRHDRSLDEAYFEDMFRDNADPWNFETSAYEQAKFDRTIAALDTRDYGRGLEVGCANGVLTRRLAPHCGALTAIDISRTALAAAQARCIDQPNITFARMNFPRQTPQDAWFELILLSEVAYYWDDEDLALAADWIDGHLVPGGDLLLVHWTGATDYPQSGDDAVGKLWHRLGAGFLPPVLQDRHTDYRLDLWRRPA